MRENRCAPRPQEGRPCPACGDRLDEITDRCDRGLGLRRWACPECGHSETEAAGEEEAPLAEEPTEHRPGSPAKMKVMHRRAARRELLFHPGDIQGAERIAHAAAGDSPARKRVKGVARHRGKWRARVWDPARGKNVSLGLYATQREAVEAVIQYRQKTN